MKVLLTGGRGFIGRHCLDQLVTKGYEVHAISSKPQISNTEVQWHQVDLLDTVKVRALIREIKPSHLLHFAWYTEYGLYWTAQENMKWVEASLNLMQEFQECNGQRFVAAGTCAEYDWSHDFCNEVVTPCRPETFYGAAKYSTHLLLKAWAKQTGLSSAWGRVFLLYGPGEHSDRLAASVINALLRGEPALCTSGDQVRDFMYVEDVAAGFVALLESDVRGAVNIASGKGVQLKSLVYKIADKLGRRDLVQLGAVPNKMNEPAKLIADVARLQHEVGFSPSIEIEQGIILAIEARKKILEQN